MQKLMTKKKKKKGNNNKDVIVVLQYVRVLILNNQDLIGIHQK